MTLSSVTLPPLSATSISSEIKSIQVSVARMMNIAGEAPTLASSLTHSVFNISNALGAAGAVLIIA